MTINSTTNRVSYSGNGSTTLFPFSYKFLTAADLVVIEKVTATGVEAVKTLTTHYTVSGAGEENGGSITMLSAPASGTELIIYRDPSPTQDLDLVENDELPPESLEDVLDKNAMMIQRLREVDQRTIRLPEGFTASFDTFLPGLIVGDSVLKIKTAGDGFEMGPTSNEIVNAEANANAAAASAAAANTAKTGAQTAQAAAETAQASAEAAKNAAIAALNSVTWQDVIFISAADSPVTLDFTYSGCMLSCDTSAGNIVINLPSIADLDLAFPWVVGIKKGSSDGNTVSVNRNGTDTIDGLTSKSHSTPSSGAVYIPDTDPTPDRWTTAEFGATAGNMTVDTFSGTGAQTAFTLSVDPGSENNTSAYINGVYQQKDSYSLVGTTLTFNGAPAPGTNNIQVISGTTLSVGTPADNTVSALKIVDLAVTESKLSAALQGKIASVGARASQNNSQVIASSVPTTMTFSTETYDTNAALNPATGRFTCPVGHDGYYDIKAAAHSVDATTWSASHVFDITIVKNGVAYSKSRRAAPAATVSHGSNISDTIYLAGLDTIDIALYHNRGADVTLMNDANFNYFSIQKRASL